MGPEQHNAMQLLEYRGKILERCAEKLGANRMQW